jgi:ComF family protein
MKMGKWQKDEKGRSGKGRGGGPAAEQPQPCRRQTHFTRKFCREYIDPMLSGLITALSTDSAWPSLASQCAVCRSWPTDPVCAPCTTRFRSEKPRCRTCALALPAGLSIGPVPPSDRCVACLKSPPPVDAALAAVSYAYPWSTLVARYKFGGHPGWANTFARLLLKAPSVPEALAALDSGDWILPMPLSPQRLEARGFNQAWQLVRALAAVSGCKGRADASLLLRTRDTPPQTSLARRARLRNVDGAFAVEPLRLGAIENRRVLLVDDVMTSGASVFAAAHTLRRAGAAHITAIVIARTENP